MAPPPPSFLFVFSRTSVDTKASALHLLLPQQNVIQKAQEEKESLLYLLIFCFLCSFSHLMFQCSFFHRFPCVYRAACLARSFRRVGVHRVLCSSSLILSCSPQLGKDAVGAVWSRANGSSFGRRAHAHHWLQNQSFRVECAVLLIGLPLSAKRLSSLAAFVGFPLSLVFGSLIMMCIGMNFFEFIV